MASESIFDFLKGGKPISLEHFQPDTAEKESKESIEQLEAENWALYTLNPEGRSCPLDCIIVHVKTFSTNCACPNYTFSNCKFITLPIPQSCMSF